VLHDAILERVERDDGETGADQQSGAGIRQERVEMLELAVDPDAERLEGPGGGVDALVASLGHRPPHQLRELPGGRDLRGAARFDDGARNAPGEALLAVLED
jgi:hypothetical protein